MSVGEIASASKSARMAFLPLINITIKKKPLKFAAWGEIEYYLKCAFSLGIPKHY